MLDKRSLKSRGVPLPNEFIKKKNIKKLSAGRMKPKGSVLLNAILSLILLKNFIFSPM